MTGFSWKQKKLDAIQTKIRRMKTMSQGDNPNPDVAIQHPDYVRDAQQKKYTKLETEVTDKCKKYQDRAVQRRNKLGGKD